MIEGIKMALPFPLIYIYIYIYIYKGAFPALWQLMHLGTWCTVLYIMCPKPYIIISHRLHHSGKRVSAENRWSKFQMFKVGLKFGGGLLGRYISLNTHYCSIIFVIYSPHEVYLSCSQCLSYSSMFDMKWSLHGLSK